MTGRQVTRENAHDVATWVNENGGHASFDACGPGVVLSTPTDDVTAMPGAWVLRGRQGEFYVSEPSH